MGAYDEWLKQAQQIYAPQMDFLDAQAAQAKQRAATGQAQVGQLYGALSKDILAEQPGIKKNYGSGIAGVDSSYDDAMAAINAMYANDQKNQMDILSRLGIQQAAPNNLGQIAQDKGLINGILTADSQGSQNALRQMLQSALSFNTEQSNVSKIEGANQKSLIGRQLGDLLAQIVGKKADVQTQIGSTANDMRSQYMQQQMAQQQAELAQSNKDREFNLRLAELAAKYGPKANQSVDPMSQVNQLAAQLYGNPTSAGNAVAALMDAWGANPGISNAAQLYSTTSQRLSNNSPNYAKSSEPGKISQLAALLFKVLQGQGRPAQTP